MGEWVAIRLDALSFTFQSRRERCISLKHKRRLKSLRNLSSNAGHNTLNLAVLHEMRLSPKW